MPFPSLSQLYHSNTQKTTKNIECLLPLQKKLGAPSANGKMMGVPRRFPWQGSARLAR
jgi:hypothetical protein